MERNSRLILMMRNGRNAHGDTLISLLVATLIFSFVAMGVMGLMSVNVIESNKISTRTDNMFAAKVGLEKLSRTVRMARNFGDVYGYIPLNTNNYYAPPGMTEDYSAIQGSSSVTQSDVDQGTATSSSSRFPSPTANPDYRPGEAGAAGPWPWGGQPYQLSQDTLIVQVPVFNQDGFPVSASGSGGAQSVGAVDTYVYKVVPDPGRTAINGANFYQLQLVIYPSLGGSTNRPPTMQTGVPITLMSGIVGPIDPATNTVAAFQYVHRNPGYVPGAGLPAGPVQTNFSPGNKNEQELNSFTGVIANFQLMSMDAAKRVSVMPLRTEMFLRNNLQASLMGVANP